MPEQRDATALLKAVATVIREHVSAAVTAFVERVEKIERTLSELPTPKDGKDGADGKSVTVDELQPLVDQAVAASFVALPPPKDGKDGQDGKSVTTDDVRPVVARLLADWGKPKDGKDGIDGKSVSADDVIPVVREWFDAIPKPKDGRDGVDGKSVTLAEIREFVESLHAKWELDWERRAMEVNQRCLDRFEKPKDGKDGKDGLGWDDMTETFDGRRTWTRRYTRGDQVKEFTWKVPALIECGVWLHDRQYEQGDGVTCGGNYWIALTDTKARPGDGNSDWRLAVRKGRDGKDAR
jgi:hypothetical protein